MSKYVLTNAVLIDGTGGEPQPGSGLVVDGEKIHSVGPSGSLPVPADAMVIDLEGKTLMPGIIDAHTHLTYHRSEYALILQQMNESLELNTIKAVESAGMILDMGCTAIGDGACRGHIALGIRDGVRQGLIRGPKVVAAGPMISGSSGIADHTAAWGYADHDAYLGMCVNGREQVVAAVRKQMREGVDWVKLTGSGTPGNPWIGGRIQDLVYDELAAAVQEAAKFNKRVHVHAHDPIGPQAAAKAGAVSVHSGEFLDEEGLLVLKEYSCVFVPTIAWLHYRTNESYAREYLRSFKPTDAQIQVFIDECQDAYDACREAIPAAHRLGTPMGLGSDAAHVFPPFDIAFEMQYYQDLGIPPLDIITCATQQSAVAVGRGDDWGTLEQGKAADLLVVDGDPARDVTVLRDKDRIEAIVVDGTFQKNTLHEAAAAA
ncbi:MAG: amidohydrolase family protein [Actinomycetia bacterium]|nr:amidohydrolase family protein [Actinomycetes bacterium]